MRRLWLDANVIIRFLTGEPVDHHAKTVRLMARAERGEVELVVSDLILAEVVWVLRTFYKFSMEQIAEVLLAFVSSPGIHASDPELQIRAIELARDKNVDFVDAYLALTAAARREPVCTFDKTDFKRLPASWVQPNGS